MKNHPFLQLVSLDENQKILLTVLPREHIYGTVFSDEISGYLFIRPSYRFGLAHMRHKLIGDFDTILWEGRNKKSGQFFKIKLSEAVQE